MSKSSYEVAKWYIGFIKVPEHRIKPKQLHKKWNKNGNIEGTYNGYVLINKRDGYGTMHYDNDNIYKGYWKDGKQNGNGEVYIVKDKRWMKGKWDNGKRVSWENN